MTAENVADFLHRLSRGLATELLGVESDRQLVERVLATRDESALLTIVLRHGAMVYHVCRRVLRHPQDAEDAFQATFLVLAQRLDTLRRHSSLAGWLHGVALRVARKAKARTIAQQRWEAGAARPETMPPDDPAWSEVCSILDAELNRLPDKWRLPLVLCHLEGRTQDEAADQLGWSKSTLRRRLDRARAALGRRLTGRGLAGSVALSAALTSDSSAVTAMSPECVPSTVTAALAVASGKPLALVASARVTELTEGVLRTMFVKKIGIVAGALMVLALVVAVGGRFSAAQAAPTDATPGRVAQDSVRPVDSIALSERASTRTEKPEPKNDPKKEPEPVTFAGHTMGATCVGFSPDGKRVVSCSQLRGEVKVWDAEKATELLAFQAHTHRASSAGFSPDGTEILTCGRSAKGEVKVWDAEKGTELHDFKGHTGDVDCARFSPDGKRIASLGKDKTVRVWDAASCKELLTLKDEFMLSRDISFSPDGKRIATIVSPSRTTGYVAVWDAESGKELFTLKRQMKPGYSVCFSPDGKRLACGYAWNTDGRQIPSEITVWDTEKAKELLTLKGHTTIAFCICFSPDGKRLASAGGDSTVRVWDAESGKELQTLKGHTGQVICICFSPDGKRLASASGDRTVKVWPVDQVK